MNVLLGLILSDEFGLDARSEQRRRIGGRPDILVFVKGLKVGIEGSYSASDALGDAKEKVRKGIAGIIKRSGTVSPADNDGQFPAGQ